MTIPLDSAKVPVLTPEKAIEVAAGKFGQLGPVMKRLGEPQDLSLQEIRDSHRQIMDTLAVLLLTQISLLNTHVSRVVPAGMALVHGGRG